MTYIAPEVDAARWIQNMGDAGAPKRKQQDSVSTNLPQLWERKTIKRLLSVFQVNCNNINATLKDFATI